jgi:hypothetical protein
MLDAARHENLNVRPDARSCPVVLPPEWSDYFQRRGPQTWQGDEIRRYVRSHFPIPALLEVTTPLRAIPREPARHVVLMKTISRQGSSFLHADQLYPGERIELTLPTGRREYMVVRCVRHNDRCFEIGTELA